MQVKKIASIATTDGVFKNMLIRAEVTETLKLLLTDGGVPYWLIFRRSTPEILVDPSKLEEAEKQLDEAIAEAARYITNCINTIKTLASKGYKFEVVE